jgi:hypothetical protein
LVEVSVSQINAPLKSSSPSDTAEFTHQVRLEETHMDTTTLLVIVLILFLVGGGGWYGRGRWY